MSLANQNVEVLLHDKSLWKQNRKIRLLEEMFSFLWRARAQSVAVRDQEPWSKWWHGALRGQSYHPQRHVYLETMTYERCSDLAVNWRASSTCPTFSIALLPYSQPSLGGVTYNQSLSRQSQSNRHLRTQTATNIATAASTWGSWNQGKRKSSKRTHKWDDSAVQIRKFKIKDNAYPQNLNRILCHTRHLCKKISLTLET